MLLLLPYYRLVFCVVVIVVNVEYAVALDVDFEGFGFPRLWNLSQPDCLFHLTDLGEFCCCCCLGCCVKDNARKED